MKVLAVSAINYGQKFYSNSNRAGQNTAPSQDSTNLITPQALYNKIQFTGGLEMKTIPELIEFMEKTIKPFLDETKPFYEKSYNIRKKMSRAVDDFDAEKIKFNPIEFKEVKRLRIDELHNNEQEFYYLLNKSENYYSTKETSDYAWDLFRSEYFSIPEFLRKPYGAFLRMKKDTVNGLKNITVENLVPELARKKQDIHKTGSAARSGFSGYTHAHLMYKRYNKMREIGLWDVNEYRKTALEAQRGMEQHKQNLSEIEKVVSDAENLYNHGMFIEYDYDLLKSVPKRGQQVISRNAKKFNDIASKTQLDANESKQLDDILKKQKELIEDLWNRIEVDKKAYFEREAKAKAEWKAQAKAEEEALRKIYGDDIPF